MAIKIWIADDHAVFRSGITALLEKETDFEIIGESGEGESTITAVREQAVDVLLLDISMPGLNGTKVARILLEEKPSLGIVVLTMHEDEYYLQELLRAGVRGYVLKKSTGSELLQAIRAAFNGNSFIDPALAKHVISPYVGKRKGKGTGRPGLLTPREEEICSLLAQGYTNVEVGQKLCISDRTVETHRTNIMTKLDLKSRADLVRFAIDHGLLKM